MAVNGFPLLTTALLLPIVGAVVVAVLPKGGRAALPKQVALAFSLLTLVVVAVVGFGFETGGDRYQFTETHDWIAAFGAHPRMSPPMLWAIPASSARG